MKSFYLLNTHKNYDFPCPEVKPTLTSTYTHTYTLLYVCACKKDEKQMVTNRGTTDTPLFSYYKPIVFVCWDEDDIVLAQLR